MAGRSVVIPILALLLQSAAGCSHAASGEVPAAAPAGVPVPRGLQTCAPGGPSASDMEHLVSTLGGRSLGCFQSSDTIELHGSKKIYPVPLEYALAVEVKGGPYAAQDLDRLKSEVTDGWKGSDPLSQDTRADYEQRLNGWIETSAPEGASKPPEGLKRPVLVSIEQLDPKSFAVVTIRQRPVSLDGEFFSATKADAAAVVLRHAKLVRLSITRELRSTSDVEAVREEMEDWVFAVVSSP